MRFRGPPGRHPAPAFGREDQRSAALADEREPPGLVQRPAPEVEPELEQRQREHGRLAYEAELRQPLVLDAVEGDHLDDVAGGIVEVERPRVPVVEVEDDLAGLAVRQRLGRGGEQIVEAIGRREEGEVVERLALACDELELGLAGAEPFVEVPQLRQQPLRRSQANL